MELEGRDIERQKELKHIKIKPVICDKKKLRKNELKEIKAGTGSTTHERISLLN